MSPTPRKSTKSRPRKAAVKAVESVLDSLETPSHPPGNAKRSGNTPENDPVGDAGESPGSTGESPGSTGAGLDLAAVERLAGQGLTLAEILVELGWEEPLRPSRKVQLEAAIKRGRAKGSAALKQAHYNAAIEGRVSAQSRMLSMLEENNDPDEDAGETEFIVERVIIGEETKTD